MILPPHDKSPDGTYKRKYQDNAAKYRSELLENDFGGNFINASNKIFENGKKTDDQN